MTLYNMALSDKSEIVDLKVPKRYKVLIKKNYEEAFKLGLATIHKENSLGKNQFSLFKVKFSVKFTFVILPSRSVA